MSSIDDLIELAKRHIESNLKVVEFYRRRAEAGEADSVELLERVQRSQAILEGNLARLVDERKKPPP
jgi:hypothetical protein